jgi:hypothetical protein
MMDDAHRCCTLPKNEDVCENIKQENSEYRVAKLRRRRRAAIEDVRALEML